MASSILDEKLSSCPECNETRGASYNYYDIRCADKFGENSCIYGKTIVSVIFLKIGFCWHCNQKCTVSYLLLRAHGKVVIQ